MTNTEFTHASETKQDKKKTTIKRGKQAYLYKPVFFTVTKASSDRAYIPHFFHKLMRATFYFWESL